MAKKTPPVVAEPNSHEVRIWILRRLLRNINPTPACVVRIHPQLRPGWSATALNYPMNAVTTTLAYDSSGRLDLAATATGRQSRKFA